MPAVIAAMLAVFLWRNTTALDPYEPLSLPGEPLRVQAIAFDWKWLFIYPDLGIATVDELAFPADRQLALDLTSETVMQALFVPALGGQIYAMGGMVTHLHLAADGPGRFRGRNTQYNGEQFRRAAIRGRGDDGSRFQRLGGRDTCGGRGRSTPQATLFWRGEALPQRSPKSLDGALPLRFAPCLTALFEQGRGRRSEGVE